MSESVGAAVLNVAIFGPVALAVVLRLWRPLPGRTALRIGVAGSALGLAAIAALWWSYPAPGTSRIAFETNRS